jgi:hypothetical protein
MNISLDDYWLIKFAECCQPNPALLLEVVLLLKLAAEHVNSTLYF